MFYLQVSGIGRSYYAMFHAVRALLALEQFDSKRHSGVMAYFNQQYIKTRKIEEEYYKMLSTAFAFRHDSDYSDFYSASQEEAAVQLNNAKKFIKRLQQCIKEIAKTS